MTKLIEKNTTIPANAEQVFSTADDNQTAVTIHVLQGERERAQDNKSLGRFDLTDIPPAPRGLPQVEVAFDIDANGILNVSAKDKATGKTQNIVIKASSGLTDEEIEKMVSDAVSHAEEDKKFRELVDARNQADSLIHASEKSLKELGEKASGEERHAVESAISDLKSAMEKGEKDAIEAKTSALAQASAAIAQKLYAQQGEQEAGSGGATAAGEGDSGSEEVVDAEFEEVDDDRKSKSG
jgi:molecular chaperone DnaK